MIIALNKVTPDANLELYASNFIPNYYKQSRLQPQALSSLAAFFPPTGGAIGTGGTGQAAPCKTCPSGCRTETKVETYYARRARQSANDIPLAMNRRIVKCDDTSQAPRTSCTDEIARIKQQYGVNGLRGLSGCTACSRGLSGCTACSRGLSGCTACSRGLSGCTACSRGLSGCTACSGGYTSRM